MEQQQKTPKALFSNGLACSQAILTAHAERYGLTTEQAMRLSAGFAAGMRIAETCGAATGAIMVLGLHSCGSECANQQGRKKVYALTKKFLSEFENLNGSIKCKDLLGCDISTAKGLKTATDKKLFKTKCVKIVANSEKTLERILNNKE